MSYNITIKLNPEIILDAIKKGVEHINIEINLKDIATTNISNNQIYSGIEILGMRAEG